MKNKLLLLSAALFGAVSFGNYVHSMDLTQNMEKREACVNRLKEVWQVSNILIENGLNTTKEDFDFICQKDPSIIYQGLTISLQHTYNLYKNFVFSTGEAIENYKFVISNIIQRTGTDHEGLAKLNNALPIFSDLEDLYLSGDNFGFIRRFDSNRQKLNKILHTPRIIFNSNWLSAEKYKYGYEKNSIKYAIKYNDMDSIIKISAQPSFKYDEYLLDFSVLHGNIDAFKFFSVNNLPVTEETCKKAIIGGNHGIIQLCKQKNDCFGSDDCLINSVRLHRYKITSWISQNYTYKVNLQDIVKSGNIPMFFEIIQDPSYDLNKSKLLHMSVYYDQKEMAEILLIDGADTNFTNLQNKKPIDVAHTDEMRDLLRQYGAN